MRRQTAERVLVCAIHFFVATASLLKGRAFLASEHVILFLSSLLLDMECEGHTFPAWIAPRGGASHGILLGVTMVPALGVALDPGTLPPAISTSPVHLRKLYTSAFGLLALLALLGPKDRRGVLRLRSSFAFLLAICGILLCRSEPELLQPVLQRVVGLSPVISAFTSPFSVRHAEDRGLTFLHTHM